MKTDGHTTGVDRGTIKGKREVDGRESGMDGMAWEYSVVVTLLYIVDFLRFSLYIPPYSSYHDNSYLSTYLSPPGAP